MKNVWLKSPPCPTIFLIYRNVFETLKTEFDKEQIIFSFFFCMTASPLSLSFTKSFFPVNSVAKMLLWFLKINHPFRCKRFTWIKIARVSRALPPFVYFSVLFFCGTHICPHVCSVLRQHYLRQTID